MLCLWVCLSAVWWWAGHHEQDQDQWGGLFHQLVYLVLTMSNTPFREHAVSATSPAGLPVAQVRPSVRPNIEACTLITPVSVIHNRGGAEGAVWHLSFPHSLIKKTHCEIWVFYTLTCQINIIFSKPVHFWLQSHNGCEVVPQLRRWTAFPQVVIFSAPTDQQYKRCVSVTKRHTWEKCSHTHTLPVLTSRQVAANTGKEAAETEKPHVLNEMWLRNSSSFKNSVVGILTESAAEVKHGFRGASQTAAGWDELALYLYI